MDEILKVLGKRIWQLRKKSNLTQERLAEGIELHGSYVGLIERGQKAPSLRTLEKIADFFSVSISDLLLPEKEWDERNMKKKQIMRALDGRSVEDLERIRRLIEIIFG